MEAYFIVNACFQVHFFRQKNLVLVNSPLAQSLSCHKVEFAVVLLDKLKIQFITKHQSS